MAETIHNQSIDVSAITAPSESNNCTLRLSSRGGGFISWQEFGKSATTKSTQIVTPIVTSFIGDPSREVLVVGPAHMSRRGWVSAGQVG